ncbi:MAG: hypothetical protein EZS28_024412, partial [Streblomastix strix]
MTNEMQIAFTADTPAALEPPPPEDMLEGLTLDDDIKMVRAPVWKGDELNTDGILVGGSGTRSYSSNPHRRNPGSLLSTHSQDKRNYRKYGERRRRSLKEINLWTEQDQQGQYIEPSAFFNMNSNEGLNAEDQPSTLKFSSRLAAKSAASAIARFAAGHIIM